MAARPKLIADRTKHRTETRGVPQALEPLQTSLTLAHGTIRSPFKSLRKKRVAARALRRRCTKMSSTSPASSTARHSQPRSPLIIRQSSSKCQMFEHAPRAPQSSGVLRPEPQRPEADGLVRDLNSSGQHQLGHVTQTHTEAVVKPHAPTDDLRREAIAFVECGAGRPLGHGDIRADRQRLDNSPKGKKRWGLEGAKWGCDGLLSNGSLPARRGPFEVSIDFSDTTGRRPSPGNRHARAAGG